ncbi:MAG: hypothetical protein PHH16_05300 [Candidatus Gracilibacteria bacterium]|nr:hypothetical protein [Candidatus Gracilibacteria bacterium]
MNTMNTEQTSDAEDILQGNEDISRLFSPFSPKTVEEQCLLEKFTPSMLAEIREFLPFFDKEDMDNVRSCASPVNCLYVVASILSKIRGKQAASHSVKENVSYFHMEEASEIVRRILEKR